MNSMTGFGRAEIARKNCRVAMELISINSRYLECVFRLPRSLAGLEGKIKEIVGRHIGRGKITVTINLDETFGQAELIRTDLAEAYYRQLLKLKKKLRLKGDIEIEDLVAIPELMARPGEDVAGEAYWPDIQKILTKALRELKRMRAAEGRNLRREMINLCRQIRRLVGAIEKEAPKNIVEYRDRLARRVAELGGGVQIDPKRLAEEITIYADRADISEECTRLYSHLDLYRQTLQNNHEPVGKRMTFILQEMSREANTIGSKALSGDTAALAITLKETVEKLREQAQNIE